MKIVQLNAWMGHLLHPTLKFIAAEAPDILCAQEILSAKEGNGLYDFYQTHERISELFPNKFFSPTYTFEALGETCRYGNAIYSKYPLSEMQTVFTVGEYQDGIDINALKQTGEIRNVQYCTVTAPSGHHFFIVNHHGYHNTNFDGTRASEDSMRNVVSTLQKLSGPLVICGDMNANPSSNTVGILNSLRLRNLSTEYGLRTTLSPVHRFNFDLVSDYIFISPDMDLKDFTASKHVISDHKPLVVVIDI